MVQQKIAQVANINTSAMHIHALSMGQLVLCPSIRGNWCDGFDDALQSDRISLQG